MKVNNEEKILVLATAQKNSMRLIEYGFSLALATKGELHILHVQGGNSIFDGNDTLRMLQRLVEYGSRLGACVHVQCDNDVARYVGQFVRDEGITRLVAGQPPVDGQETTWSRIQSQLPKELEVHVVDKEEGMEKRRIG